MLVNPLLTEFSKQIKVEICTSYIYNNLYQLNIDLNLVTCNNLYKTIYTDLIKNIEGIPSVMLVHKLSRLQMLGQFILK